jgi:hypothetical protein
MVEYILMKQMRLIQQKDWVYAVAAELFDVRADGGEYASRRRGRRQAERETQLTIEVAAPERRVVAIGQPEDVRRSRRATSCSPRRLDDRTLRVRHAISAIVWMMFREHSYALFRGRNLRCRSHSRGANIGPHITWNHKMALSASPDCQRQ